MESEYQSALDPETKRRYKENLMLESEELPDPYAVPDKQWMSTGQKLKAFHTDNGGEYMSTKFVKTEGVKHKHTIPKTPEQNGVAERFNRTSP